MTSLSSVDTHYTSLLSAFSLAFRPPTYRTIATEAPKRILVITFDDGMRLRAVNWQYESRCIIDTVARIYLSMR